MTIILHMLMIIGLAQVVAILSAMGLALGRVSVQKGWSFDLFFIDRLERLFTRLLGGKNK